MNQYHVSALGFVIEGNQCQVYSKSVWDTHRMRITKISLPHPGSKSPSVNTGQWRHCEEPKATWQSRGPHSVINDRARRVGGFNTGLPRFARNDQAVKFVFAIESLCFHDGRYL